MAKIEDMLPVQDDMDLDEPVVPEPLSAEIRAEMEVDPADEPEEDLKRNRLQSMKRSVFGVEVGGIIIERIVNFDGNY
ncbi:hypothetical protein SARC_12640 [Sphaeroforma arctica JP610]|uniref:Uncharacterized protein n=1 Tax=Sphaeroforma arctica JP610 TaxID=667725 RepID=A0A0L0FEA7_9EUKA|nr:hypothetical protein SARC_12640 [Sphaeroforma arctica JP610]KNC74821.1 hypothetical protein SARC_12640 [Sphaeroforma arctica JP610]|eukprot:XP_014148723.1 hypothetical protein SARC_12640 [Sphaeroforma arctica JP610]